MADAFYLPVGENRFAPTEHTRGPWTPDAQHFGPPSALLVRAMENLPAERAAALARVTVEILGPAPLTELVVTARVHRPGRSVELLGAELDDGERTVARARAWRIATSDSTAVASNVASGPGADGTAGAALPPVERTAPARWPEGWGGGFLDAMEWRAVAGSPDAPGPATVWVRQRVAVVDGEEPSPTQRVMTVADCGNGVSNRLDPSSWWFINSDLTVHLHRNPTGEWIGLDAETTIGPDGLGTATSRLHDRYGYLGNGAQALLVRRRSEQRAG